MKLQSTLLLAAQLTLSVAQSSSTVYLIRHGEKPASGSGLDQQGQQRAQCLVNVFGSSSQYDIQYIMAETPQPDGSQQRPYDTVLPLSQSLGITIDTSCSRDDSDCVANVVDNYSGPGNILICWEHGQLTNIVTALGDDNAPEYPSSNFNLIWTDPSPYDSITSITSEDCPGLDSDSQSASRLRMSRRWVA